MSLSHSLYIIATPIGNLGDMTYRAVETLKAVDIILCEDTRVSGKLLSAYGITTRKQAYHEHNAAEMRPKVLGWLAEGKKVALISDAGMPLISDPGYKLVEACVEEGVAITCVPGASASLTALALSGLPTDRFFFAGFLPAKRSARQKALQELSAIPATLVFYETAPRLIESLEDMQAVWGERTIAVARELTKKFEEVRRGPAATLLAHYHQHGAPKGEIVMVVEAGAQDAQETGDDDVQALLRKCLAKGMSVKDATAEVAAQTGRKKKDVYGLALKAKDNG